MQDKVKKHQIVFKIESFYIYVLTFILNSAKNGCVRPHIDIHEYEYEIHQNNIKNNIKSIKPDIVREVCKRLSRVEVKKYTQRLFAPLRNCTKERKKC